MRRTLLHDLAWAMNNPDEPFDIFGATLRSRFEAVPKKIVGDCWEWGGPRSNGPSRSGYGRMYVGKQYVLVHRLAYRLHWGHWPENALHRCDNPPCINAELHLFDGTLTDNNRDMAAKGRHWALKKTHCPAGHPYAGENLIRMASGGRDCRLCQKQRNREYQARKRAAAKAGATSVGDGAGPG